MYFPRKFILKSIKTKDNRKNTIVAYKQYHGLYMIEAKEDVDNILAKEEMEVDMDGLHQMEIFFTSEKTQIFSEEEIVYQKEQAEKKKHIDEAKEWYNTLSIRDRKRIDWLIEDSQPIITAGYAAAVPSAFGA
jgi:hypothetical protein